MTDDTGGASPAAGVRKRRHNIRENGKFAKPASPHHGKIESSYARTELTRTRAFTPDRDTAVTPQDGRRS